MGRREAAALQSESLGLWREIGNPALLAYCLNNVGYDRYIGGDYDGALSMYVEALIKAEEVEDRRLQAMILDGMAATYRDRGEFDRAMETYARVFSLTGSIGDQVLVSWALDGLGHTHRLMGDLDRALALFEQALSIAGREGLSAQVNLSTASIDIVRIEQGDATAVQDLNRVAAALRQMSAYLDLGRVLLWLAYAQYLTGQRDQAQETLIEMVRQGRRLGCRPFSLAEGRRLMTFLTWGTKQLPRETQLHSWIAPLAESPVPSLETAPLPAQMPRLEVRAFGPGQVWREGELLTIAHWGRSANARELFFYLLEYSPARKEDIGLHFWPDLSMARMTSSFHAAKYRARHALGVEFVVYENEQYRLNSMITLWYDVAEFKRLIEASRRRHGFGLSSACARRYSTRTITSPMSMRTGRLPRAELHSRFLKRWNARWPFCCTNMAMTMIACQRGLEIDYFRENLHRALMFSLAATGHTTGALRHYEAVASAWRRIEDGADAEMTSLAARIRAGQPLVSNSVS
jgi:DNA-binding SARP family transcriptional activator